MLTPCATVRLATASLVGVVGWPFLVFYVIGLVQLHDTTSPYWWLTAIMTVWLAVLQLRLTRWLWRFLDPRRDRVRRV